MNAKREGLRDYFFVFKESTKNFIKNDDFSKAAALTYYGLFACIPLLLLAVYIISNYISSSDEEAMRQLSQMTVLISPDFQKIIFTEVRAMSRIEGLLGTVSIISLLYATTPLATAVRYFFYDMFKMEHIKPFLIGKVRDILVVVLFLLLLVCLVVSEIIFTDIATYLLGKSGFILFIFTLSINPLVSLVFIGVFYYAFSPRRLKIKYIITASVLTTLLWGIIRPSFAYFIAINPNFGLAFGSLKAIFVLFLWIYLSFSVVLFSGEVMATLCKKDVMILKNLFIKTKLSENIRVMLIRKFSKLYDKDEIIFNEKDISNEVYYIISGSVSIIKAGINIAILREGRYFGEMAALVNSQRSALAIALEPQTNIVKIPKEDFYNILMEERNVLYSLLNKTINSLKAKDGII
ncbi:MAG: YihY family inner membrane protein [Candidatus Magnetoovum sp. WYHC-5]|nr:YihY family inner membrane protein [Candidatus Magnetoovum sp. WYHC-5]